MVNRLSLLFSLLSVLALTGCGGVATGAVDNRATDASGAANICFRGFVDSATDTLLTVSGLEFTVSKQPVLFKEDGTKAKLTDLVVDSYLIIAAQRQGDTWLLRRAQIVPVDEPDRDLEAIGKITAI